jgi:uncharacterized protein (TIRG00374 family)
MKRWYFWVGLLLSALFLFLALRGLPLDSLWKTIKSASFWWLIPAVLVYFIAVWARAWRWHYLLLPIKPIPTLKVFPVLTIGYMGNNIFPARAGELIRSVILKRNHNVSISSSLATILIERIFDGIVVLGFIFINLGEVISLGNFQFIAFWGSVFFLSAFLIVLAMALYPAKASMALSKKINVLVPLKWRERVVDFFNRFIDGLSSLRSPTALLMVVATSVLIWIIESTVYWLVMQAFLFDVSFINLVFINGAVNLATTLPSAPGYIGTFDAPGIVLLKAFGVDAATAAGYMLVLHATLWMPITALGAGFFLRSGINLSEELDQAKKESNSK